MLDGSVYRVGGGPEKGAVKSQVGREACVPERVTKIIMLALAGWLSWLE